MSQIATNIQRVAATLTGIYSKDELSSLLFKSAKKFIKAHYDQLQREQVPQTLLNLAQDSKIPPKDPLAQVCAVPFAKRTYYELFLETLPKDQLIIWHELVWNGMLTDEEIRQRLGIEVSVMTEKSYHKNGPIYKSKEMLPGFELFQPKTERFGYWGDQNQPIYLSLALGLRQILVEYYDQPENAKLTPVAEPTITEFQYLSGEQDIALELPRVLTYKAQGQIAFTAKDRPVQTTLIKMQRSLSLKEFFPGLEDKKVKLLRTGMLAAISAHIKPPKGSTTSYEILRSFIQEKYPRALTGLMTLPDIKGMSYIDDGYVEHPEAGFLQFFKELPAGEWVSFDHVQHYIRYKLLQFQPFSAYVARDKLYYEYVEAGGYDNKHYIKKHIYAQAIEQSFVRGSFFLLAALGLCDLAYDLPDTTRIGRDCFSVWDGLKFVRRTALGDYACGLAKEYQPTESGAGKKITLSPETLMILTEDTDNSAAAILEPYTERLGANRFRTDSQLFLKNIRSKSELESKIALFKQVIGAELPPNWQAFLKDIQNKVNPFESVDEFQAFKIPPDNKALIQLIAQDPIIKNLVIKAEGFIILIPKGHYAAFRRRMQEFGYLLT
jgi:hypothetical protein